MVLWETSAVTALLTCTLLLSVPHALASATKRAGCSLVPTASAGAAFAGMTGSIQVEQSACVTPPYEMKPACVRLYVSVAGMPVSPAGAGVEYGYDFFSFGNTTSADGSALGDNWPVEAPTGKYAPTLFVKVLETHTYAEDSTDAYARAITMVASSDKSVLGRSFAIMNDGTNPLARIAQCVIGIASTDDNTDATPATGPESLLFSAANLVAPVAETSNASATFSFSRYDVFMGTTLDVIKVTYEVKGLPVGDYQWGFNTLGVLARNSSGPLPTGLPVVVGTRPARWSLSVLDSNGTVTSQKGFMSISAVELPLPDMLGHALIIQPAGAASTSVPVAWGVMGRSQAQVLTPEEACHEDPFCGVEALQGIMWGIFGVFHIFGLSGLYILIKKHWISGAGSAQAGDGEIPDVVK